jgi:hypothetical protein
MDFAFCPILLVQPSPISGGLYFAFSRLGKSNKENQEIAIAEGHSV